MRWERVRGASRFERNAATLESTLVQSSGRAIRRRAAAAKPGRSHQTDRERGGDRLDSASPIWTSPVSRQPVKYAGLSSNRRCSAGRALEKDRATRIPNEFPFASAGTFAEASFSVCRRSDLKRSAKRREFPGSRLQPSPSWASSWTSFGRCRIVGREQSRVSGSPRRGQTSGSRRFQRSARSSRSITAARHLEQEDQSHRPGPHGADPAEI